MQFTFSREILFYTHDIYILYYVLYLSSSLGFFS